MYRFLASASPNDNAVLIWDVGSGQATPLVRSDYPHLLRCVKLQTEFLVTHDHALQMEPQWSLFAGSYDEWQYSRLEYANLGVSDPHWIGSMHRERA